MSSATLQNNKLPAVNYCVIFLQCPADNYDDDDHDEMTRILMADRNVKLNRQIASVG